MTSNPFTMRRLGIAVCSAALGAFLFVALCLPGCAALQQFAAISQVDFRFDRVTDVRIAGVAVSGRTGYSSLSAVDVARLAAAVASHEVPLDLVVHVRGTNPVTNTVDARMPRLDWTFFVEGFQNMGGETGSQVGVDQEIVQGRLEQSYLFTPGTPVDVAIPVRFNAYDKFGGSAKALFELGLAIAGVDGYSKSVRMDLVPTIETSIGRIQYPTPITVRRTVGG
jgi:hypothetical protein